MDLKKFMRFEDSDVEIITVDGTSHLQTRVYPEGISYITKLLRKYGYLEVA